MKQYRLLNKATGEETELNSEGLKELATTLLGDNVYVAEEARQILISQFSYQVDEKFTYIWVSGEIHDDGDYFFGLFQTKESGLEDFTESLKDYGGTNKDVRGIDNKYSADLGDKQLFLERYLLMD